MVDEEDSDKMIIDVPVSVPAVPIPRKKKKKGQQNNIRRKKKLREVGAPKFPLTGYVRYINERREDIRLKNLEMSAVEITKLVAEQWNKMPEGEKKPFLEAAEIDKERYVREVAEFHKNNANKEKTEKVKTPEPEEKLKSTPTKSIQIEKKLSDNPKVVLEKLKIVEKSIVNGKDFKEQKLVDFDIPIFTDEFLDHNKTFDSELRILRKSFTDYEQQNSVLEKHVENMSNGIDKLDVEMNGLDENNKILQAYLNKLRVKLSGSLSGIGGDGASLENIDQYMRDLRNMATSNSALNKAKDVIRKIDLQFSI